MKTIHPVLLAAALLSPLAAAAQTNSGVDRGIDSTGVRTETEAEIPGPSGMSRAEPVSALDKNRQQLHDEILEVRREAEDLRGVTSEQGLSKLDAATTRINELEARSTSDSDERGFNENKHKYKNELKKIRRELKGVRKHRMAAPEATQTSPSIP